MKTAKALTLACVGMLELSGRFARPLDCGATLDTYKGVSALSNGTKQLTIEACEEYNEDYGYPYQCVEYVRRFYALALGMDTSKGNGWWGDAWQFYGTAALKGLDAFPNGQTTVQPQPDDILVFDKISNQGAGHVAIVTSVTQNSISLIEQNWSLTGTITLTLTKDPQTGYWSVPPREASTAPMPVLGWLRQPSTSRWTRFIPNGVGPSGGNGTQGTAYDPHTDTMIVFGGYYANGPPGEPNDTWLLIDATGPVPTWQQLIPNAPNGLPEGRQAHSVVYDPVANRMTVFGGVSNNNGHQLLDDAWVLTSANGTGPTPEWIPLAMIGGPPAAREGHGAFYNQLTNEMFIFGGGDNGQMNVPDDLWSLQNANGSGGLPIWTELPQTNVPGRNQHFASGYDAVTNRWIMAGGCCGVPPGSYINQSWVLALNPSGTSEWTMLTPGGTLPPAGDYVRYGYDPGSDRLIVHGPTPGSGTNDTWVLTDATKAGGTPTWTNTIPRGAPGSPPEFVPFTGAAYNSSTKQFILTLNTIDESGNLSPEVWILSNADQVP